MKRYEVLVIYGLIVATMFISGCASPKSTEIIARTNPAYSITFRDGIALADRKLRTQELDELKRSVTTELLRRGVNLVPADKSEYVLSFWIEDNAISNPPILVPSDSPLLRSSLYVPTDDIAGGSRTTRRGRREPVKVEQPPTPTRGIRMRLFVTKPRSGSLLETAWEGTVDGGDDLSAKDFDVLVPRLLDHFGKNFNGKVAIAD